MAIIQNISVQDRRQAKQDTTGRQTDSARLHNWSSEQTKEYLVSGIKKTHQDGTNRIPE